MSREGTATSMAEHVAEVLEPVLAPYRFDSRQLRDREDALWSILFSAPYGGRADRFPGSPYSEGELADGEHADFYVLGSSDTGLLSVEFEGAPLVELLGEAGLTLEANRLRQALDRDLDAALGALTNAIRAYFS